MAILYTSIASEPLHQTYIKMTLHSMATPYHAKKGHNLIVLSILPHLHCCLLEMSVCLENITAKLILSFYQDKYYTLSFKQPLQSGSFSHSFQLIFARFWEELYLMSIDTIRYICNRLLATTWTMGEGSSPVK